MIDYKKLIPFKTYCKTIEYQNRLIDELEKQEIIFTDKIYKRDVGFFIIRDIGNFRWRAWKDSEYIERKDIREIPIEQLLVSVLKIFIKEKKKYLDFFINMYYN